MLESLRVGGGGCVGGVSIAFGAWRVLACSVMWVGRRKMSWRIMIQLFLAFHAKTGKTKEKVTNF